MNYGVVVFPGSNCDSDCYHAITDHLKEKAVYLWHEDSSIPNNLDVIVLPGGFSYGDYLRCGAISKFSKIMPEIINFANNGGYVIGICNGFQILTEAGLLPGALLMNTSQKFICKTIELSVENNDTKFTKSYKNQQKLHIPIAHGEGRYHINNDGLKELQDNNQIVFRYKKNPNGSIYDIAGIISMKKNVLGMMPHPERCVFNNKASLDILKI
jgi:phosphoribosylformylglycinamidine synthase subunit PurQ / glutaminase